MAHAHVGCATPPIIVDNASEIPSGGPSSDDCYTSLLHNLPHDQGLTSFDHSGKRATGCYTKQLHNVRTHFVWRGGRIHYRRRVPDALRGIVGKREIWRSLGTDSPTVAKRRVLRVAAEVEHEFEVARLRGGLTIDPMMLNGFAARRSTAEEVPPSPTLSSAPPYRVKRTCNRV
ncbi:DUF6538 domain-containing protein [Brevundimonas sp. DC300-4]|uniref:DUF6538 domain-containing protein n=1 Tax=Brevundimonas sp. DC300-4 TaxID=2804594 RepID=UPI003CE9F1EA